MPQGSYPEYIARMRQEDAWGSMLELMVLARRFRINLILFTEGRRRPEYIPATESSNTFTDHPTGVVGFQNNHFVWFRYDDMTGGRKRVATRGLWRWSTRRRAGG